jgi:hypothetical protein
VLRCPGRPRLGHLDHPALGRPPLPPLVARTPSPIISAAAVAVTAAAEHEVLARRRIELIELIELIEPSMPVAFTVKH